MNFQGILDSIRNTVGGLFQPKILSPVPDNQTLPLGTGVGAPDLRPTRNPLKQSVLGASHTNPPITEEQIRKGWEKYGNPPAATASATFAEVANKYPILRKYPGLLPSMSIKESSGGKAPTKNWFNWALYEPSYQEKDPNEVIRDVARAIGSDESNSSHYYKKFRETGNIRDMLDRYAPPTENDTALYHKQLLDWIEMFR